MIGMSTLNAYIKTHNEGVRTGEFNGLLQLFTLHAELHFTGRAVDPFMGRAEIAEAFHRQSPTDELTVLEILEEVPDILVAYGWKKAPNVQAGTLKLETEEGLVKRITITFAAKDDAQAK